MAEQDPNALVTIQLDAPRQYRDRESYIVTTIGPGSAVVRRATAIRWGFNDAEDAPLAEPWPNYGSVDEVVARLPSLSPTDRARVRAYETERGTRKGVLNALDTMEDEQAAGSAASDNSSTDKAKG